MTLATLEPLRARIAGLGLILLWLAALGCSDSTPPPAPVAADQLPGLLEKTFAKAKPELKDLAGQVISALQAQDYPKAYLVLQNLAGATGLTRDQSSLASRGLMCVHELLQSAQSKGDQNAAATLDFQRRSK
jgi:hypothetical protein